MKNINQTHPLRLATTIGLAMTMSIFLVSKTFTDQIWASAIGLALDPPLLRVQIKPGKSITKTFTIENTDTADKELVARIVPFSKSDNLGNPFLDLKSGTSWLKYFSLSNTNIKLNEPFTVKAKSKEQIIISLAIPENANLEDLYATLLISTYNNSISTENQGTLVSASIGANLLVTVTAEVNPNTILKIEKITPLTGDIIKIGRKYFADNLSPLTFSVTATNDGLFLTEAKGTLKIINKKNSEVLQLQGILPQYIIAKTSRQLQSNDSRPFNFSPNLKVIGPHLVSVDIKTENTNTSNSVEIFFLPFKAGIAVLISLILLKIIFSISHKKVDI